MAGVCVYVCVYVYDMPGEKSGSFWISRPLSATKLHLAHIADGGGLLFLAGWCVLDCKLVHGFLRLFLCVKLRYLGFDIAGAVL